MNKVTNKKGHSTPTLLALDTSTEACSVALLYQDQVTEEFATGVHHSEIILSMIEKILLESGLVISQMDCIAFGRGPGMFTGLRIGAGVVQGIAFAADLPVIPISSLAILAQGQQANKIMTAFDARMNQVYWGLFEKDKHGLMQACIDEQVVSPADVHVPQSAGWVGAGSGWDQYHEALTLVTNDAIADWQAQQFPHARHALPIACELFRTGKLLAADQALPVYLRDDVARKQATKKIDPATSQ